VKTKNGLQKKSGIAQRKPYGERSFGRKYKGKNKNIDFEEKSGSNWNLVSQRPCFEKKRLKKTKGGGQKNVKGEKVQTREPKAKQYSPTRGGMRIVTLIGREKLGN